MCATFRCENCGRLGCVDHHRCESIERAGCDLRDGDLRDLDPESENSYPFAGEV